MHCLGRCDLTFQLCWMSGKCIQPLQGSPDLPITELKEYMYRGLVPGQPNARTNNEGDRLEHYTIYHTEEMKDGTKLSDYGLQHNACLTVVRRNLLKEREQGVEAETQ